MKANYKDDTRKSEESPREESEVKLNTEKLKPDVKESKPEFKQIAPEGAIKNSIPFLSSLYVPRTKGNIRNEEDASKE